MSRDMTAVGPDASLFEIAELMRDEDIGTVLVTENYHLLGVVTDRDMVIRALAERRNVQTVKARDVMSNALVCCTEDTPVEDVLSEMAQVQVRRIPVINAAQHVVGVVSLGDLSQEKAKSAGDALRVISQPH